MKKIIAFDRGAILGEQRETCRIIREEELNPTIGIHKRMYLEEERARQAGLPPPFGPESMKAKRQACGVPHPSSSKTSTPALDAAPQIESTMSTTAWTQELAQLNRKTPPHFEKSPPPVTPPSTESDWPLLEGGVCHNTLTKRTI